MIWIPPKRDLIVGARARRDREEPPSKKCELLLNPYRFGVPYTYDGVDFDGVNDGLNRSSLFSPAATNSKKGIISVWHIADSVVTTGGTIFRGIGSSNAQATLTWNSAAANNYDLLATDESAATSEYFGSNGTYGTGTWRHILVSWDSSTGAEHFYVQDTSSITVYSASANLTVEYVNFGNAGVTGVGQYGGLTNVLDGGLCDLYFAPNQYLDFSVTANRRKFITAGSKPENLGNDGSAPTGTKPLVFLHIDQGETANNFATNRAGNGNFTLTGSLTTRATRP